MNLNSDLGEGSVHEETILRLVDSANVACGAHAGSMSISVATAWRCGELGIEVGAHPGYEDRVEFGRVERGLRPKELEALVAFQVAGLAAVAPIAYLKPHGALYHRCQSDPDAADAVARVAAKHGVGLMCQPGFAMVPAAERAGIPVYREGFADRMLLPDGRLAPRTRPDAMLPPHEAARQAVTLAKSGTVDTICVHGDTPNAGAIATAVRQALKDAGVETGPLLRR